MKKTIINQAEAIALLKDKKSLSGCKIKFDSTKVAAMDAFLLRKNGVSVPDELIWYDDDSIDFSDTPEWTDEELKKARLIRRVLTDLPLNEEVKTWIRFAHFDFTELLAKLISDFYHNVEFIQKSKPKVVSKKKKKEKEVS